MNQELQEAIWRFEVFIEKLVMFIHFPCTVEISWKKGKEPFVFWEFGKM